MNAPSMSRPESALPARTAVLWCGAGLVAATLAAYGRGLGGSFLYDDVDSVLANPTIRHLASALRPPPGLTVSGRPVLNLSFALNYAVSGTAVWSYHVLNLAIHAGAALLLFGIARRTAALRPEASAPPGRALAVAFAVALLWAVHPLQTESVAYVVQRAESLMGFFYLLALYAFIRSTAAGARGRAWAALAVGACFLGMGTKEAMATAPLVILLYDRAFVSGSFRAAWQRRRALYVSLGASWIPLAFLVAGTGGRGGTAGFASGVPWWAYLLTQFKAVALYLKLSVWPHPLVGDYGRILEGRALVVAACAALVAALLVATARLLARNSPFGFIGAWFFVILAPTSSIVPVSTEIIAEHRMYLPLAAVVALAVLSLDAVVARRPFLVAVGLVAVGFGFMTSRRAEVYRSPLAFWTDVVLKVPENAGAWNNLGNLRADRGDPSGAIGDYRRALAIAPAYAYAHYNLGKALVATGRVEEGIAHYGDALRFRPEDPAIHFNLGNALALQKREGAAADEFQLALRYDPGREAAWSGLGEALVGQGALAPAADAYAHAVALRPESAGDRVNYGSVLAQLGKLPEAAEQFREALRLEPAAADVHNNLGSLLAESGQLGEARAQFEEALRLRPEYPEARDNLERVRALQARGEPR
jgi:tetratricopeptide (TPR) repeat protein